MLIHAVLWFPKPNWNPTIVLLMKGNPKKRRGHSLNRRIGATYWNWGAKKCCIYDYNIHFSCLGWNLESASECPQESKRMKRTTKDRLSQLDAYATNMARMTSYSPAVVATPQGIVICPVHKRLLKVDLIFQ